MVSDSPLVTRWPAHALAFGSGFAYFLAFPGMDLWPLSFMALVPLIVALRGASVGRATASGWVAGFTMTVFGFYWLNDMLKTFSGFPAPLCLLFVAILSAYQAGRMALCGWLYARAERRGWPPGLVFAAAFAASEQVFPLLFPWTYAATVHQIPILLQLAELGGPILVVLVLVAANLVLAAPLLAWLERRTTKHATAGPRARAAAHIERGRHVARWAALVVAALLYGALRIPQVDAMVKAAPKATVGVVQANMSLFGKRLNKAEGLHRHLQLTRQLREAGPLDLVVWSETSVMSAVPEERAGQVLADRVTSRLGVPAIVGAVLYRPVEGPRRYVLYNSGLLANANGEICPTCRYDKHYLLAFGEYLPFGDSFPILYDWSPNSGQFSPGTSFRPLPLGDREIALFICYEDILPAFVNRIVNEGSPDLLVNMTNDAWFGDSTEPWIHFALAKFRAIEHRRYLVRSTNSGVSGFIDPVGRTVRHGGTFREEAFATEIAWLRSPTPFALLGNSPWWLVAALVFAGGFRTNPRVIRAMRSVREPPDGQAATTKARQVRREARRRASPAFQTQDETPAAKRRSSPALEEATDPAENDPPNGPDPAADGSDDPSGKQGRE